MEKIKGNEPIEGVKYAYIFHRDFNKACQNSWVGG
jgi:hypothetical protein